MTVEATFERLPSNGNIGFELLGYDIMIDETYKCKLIEVNSNPCIDTLSDRHKIFIDKLMSDTLT